MDRPALAPALTALITAALLTMSFGTAPAATVVWSSAHLKKPAAKADSAKTKPTVPSNVVWSSANMKPKAAGTPAASSRVDSASTAKPAVSMDPAPGQTTKVAVAPVTAETGTKVPTPAAVIAASTKHSMPDAVVPVPAPTAAPTAVVKAPVTAPAETVAAAVAPARTVLEPVSKPAPVAVRPAPPPAPAGGTLTPSAATAMSAAVKPAPQRAGAKAAPTRTDAKAAATVQTSSPVPSSAGPARALSTTGSSLRTSRISYLAGASAYVDAGQMDGLTAGDTVEVVRDGRAIAQLRVTFVSSKRASCDTLWTRAALVLGDAARYRSDFRRQAAAEDSLRTASVRGDSIRVAAVLAPPKGRAVRRSSRLRGRLGGRWLSVTSEGGNRYQQPALDLRADARDGMGGHMDASFDIRARRTVRSGDAGTVVDQFSRVYRASTTIRDKNDRRRITLGRQSSPTLASISLFDGALVELGDQRKTFGAFAGTQPEPLRFGWSGDLVEGGAFAEWHQKPLAAQRWSMSFGGVTSRRGTQVNRDFAFAQAWWFSKGASASVAQEVDVNSGWKRDLGEPLLSWTSTFATMRVPITPQLALQSGYDNRRSVRLWRDRETPETDFDDRYRQGAWGGTTLELAQHVRSSAEYRTGSGGDHSDTWSVSGEVYRLTRWQGSVRTRVSAFTSPGTESQLLSYGAGFNPFGQSHLEFNAGTRQTRDRLSGFEETERWQGIDLDLAVGGRWYVSGGWEQQKGRTGSTRQLQAGVSVRL